MTTSRPTVLVADSLHAESIRPLESMSNLIVDSSLSGKTLLAKLSEVNPRIVVVRSTKIKANHIAAAPNLALIVRAGAGTNNIDKAAACRRGIYVTNCPGKNAIAVAELVVGHLINMDRRLVDNAISLRQGTWAKKKFAKARGLYGRTIAVLGCGLIGREVIHRVKALGMHVKGYDPFLSRDQAQLLGIEFAESPLVACQNADALTIHVPLLDSTRNLVNAKLLNALNDGAYVIHASRGGIVCEADLMEAIERKHLRAGLDVYANEPKSSDNTFGDASISKNPSVYGTHHIGASTDQAAQAVGAAVCDIVSSYLKTGFAKNAVNFAREGKNMCFLNVRHADEPGVLAAILGVLGGNRINVHQMENKVFEGDMAACARIQVSIEPSLDILRRIQAIPQVFAANLSRMDGSAEFFPTSRL